MLIRMQRLARDSAFVGRDADLARLKTVVQGVVLGRGRVVRVEGEPGIGKTSLVSAALEDSEAAGCTTVYAEASERSQRLPLHLLFECFDISFESTDERHAEIAALLRHDVNSAAIDFGDLTSRASEHLLALIDELCAAAPVILVVDDIQWADEASLRVLQHLAQTVKQRRLLLVTICRSVQEPTGSSDLRHPELSREATVISLTSLTEPETSELVRGMVSAQAGPRLLQMVGSITGNPLYMREIVQALMLEGQIERRSGRAELVGPVPNRIPASVEIAISRRLAFLAPEVRALLETAALLGLEFNIEHLAAVQRQPPPAMLPNLRQAISASVITQNEVCLKFSHQMVHQVVHDGIPEVCRVLLHREAARALADAGAPPERVAEQLLASGSNLDRWTVEWAVSNGAALSLRAPQMGAQLLEGAVDQLTEAVAVGDEHLEPLLTQLAKVLFLLGRNAEAEQRARQVLARTRDRERAGEMYWTLARVLLSAGESQRTLEVTRESLQTPLPHLWRGRLQALYAMSARADSGDLDHAVILAGQALETTEREGDRFGVGYALCVKWLVASVCRDHITALECVDRALSLLRDDPGCHDLRAWARDNRLFTLQNLDRLTDADDNLQQALAEAERRGDGARHALHIGAAVHYFWRGRWDDAVAALDSMAADGPRFTHFGLREHGPVLLYHGVGAYIAGHRGLQAAADHHVAIGSALTVDTVGQWENSDFLVAARSLIAERDGDTQRAAATLAEVLECRPGQMMLVHQWMPDLVRLALAVHDKGLALQAMELCDFEAAREVRPARAAAAAEHCRGLLTGDPDRVLAIARHYRDKGRCFELARGLEDAAVLQAQKGFTEDARRPLAEATRLYAELGADWDTRRADARARVFGIRRGVRGPRKRPSFGWEALSPAELGVARMVAQGQSNPDIARRLLLSRRTVEAHVSRILRKLSVHSRAEIEDLVLVHTQR